MNNPLEITFARIKQNIPPQILQVVFEQGNIIITGAKNQSHIEQGVDFINNILITHLEDVQKSLLDEVIRKSKFKNLLVEGV